MSTSPLKSFLGLILLLAMALTTAFGAADEPVETGTKTADSERKAVSAGSSSSGSKSSGSSQSEKKSTDPEHKRILEDAKKISGMLTLYQKENKLYGEFSSSDYGNEYIVLISIARGIGEGWLIGGMSWNDDWVWSFRKIDKRVHVVRKNVRFRAKKGSPEESAVKHAYNDSVLFSLPIVTKGPSGGDLVDLTSVFMSDLPQISQVLRGYSFSSTKSVWGSIKGFKDNLELEVAATYSSSGHEFITSVADSRGVTVNVHYSISKLPSTGYQPRLADDRIGYFLTVIKDYSKRSDKDQFIRHINRWDLRKADAKLKQSPPKEPVIFWIENAVPFKHRKTIRDAVLEWNKAFDKAGFVNAIEVRQQPEGAEWHPEDINYNTIRWMTATPNPPFSGFGPSRVNPYTGQILDADILLNSSSFDYYKYQYETMVPEVSPGAGDGIFFWNRDQKQNARPHDERDYRWHCHRSLALSRELTFGRSVLGVQKDPSVRAEAIEELIRQGLKATVMHEVGHTLGLRHNFKGSSHLSLEDMQQSDKMEETGMIASVMDYDPANFAPAGEKQGYFFTPTIGIYDEWAILYGYQPLSGGTRGEQAELQKIAARSAEPGFAYATDEDTRHTQPDPDSGIMDLGDDGIVFAKTRVQIVKAAIQGLVDRMTAEGESYAQSRRAFNSLLFQHNIATFHAARYVGGIRVSRSHKGDKDAPTPIAPIDPEKQREALSLVEEEVFGVNAYQFPPEMYGLMLSSRWSHWGTIRTDRPDYPLHEGIAYWQNSILSRLITSRTLHRIHDNEAKIPADQDAMSTAELLDRLTRSIFSEVDNLEGGEYTNRKPGITSLRRNLQRIYLRKLSNIALGRTGTPEDCQTIAYVQISELADRMEKLLNSNVTLDSYSRAHLKESATRIRKVVDAKLSIPAP